jgi:hypothetical protein
MRMHVPVSFHLSGTDVLSEMPLRGREEDESALFAQQYPFRATFEGSAMTLRVREEDENGIEWGDDWQAEVGMTLVP